MMYACVSVVVGVVVLWCCGVMVLWRRCGACGLVKITPLFYHHNTTPWGDYPVIQYEAPPWVHCASLR